MGRDDILECGRCGFAYYIRGGSFGYNFRALLFQNFREKFLLNAALNNNGYLSYLQLPEGSLSLSSRSDVAHFRDFIIKNGHGVDILDIGCGPLPMPGYLQFNDGSNVCIIGIDPIENAAFQGLKIVGTGEYIPLCDETIDTIVFGTSLDHLVSVETTIEECKRVLRSGGHTFVWMSDRSGNRTSGMKVLMRLAKAILMRLGIIREDPVSWIGSRKIGDYWVYPDYTVYHIPKGAVDPFHSFEETPAQVIKIFSSKGFTLVNKSAENSCEVFLCFKK